MDKWRIDFREEISSASTALSNAENISRLNGYKYPKMIPRIAKTDKVKIPSGYIRTADFFREQFNLKTIVREKNLIDNIAYALQTSDLFNYFINRFDIDLSVGAIFLKIAIINGFSIIEAMLSGAMTELHKYCVIGNETCKSAGVCNYYIKDGNKNFSDKIVNLKSTGILKLDDETTDALYKIKEKRDHIHIWLAKENEYLNEIYNQKTYNDIVLLLRNLKKKFPDNLNEFKKGRLKYCRINRARNL